jgi:hypothetical protein
MGIELQFDLMNLLFRLPVKLIVNKTVSFSYYTLNRESIYLSIYTLYPFPYTMFLRRKGDLPFD